MHHGAEARANPSWRILVVEDDHALRGLIIKNLVKAGYRADGVGAGSEALERVREAKRGNENVILVLDQQLPDISGSVLIQTMHGENLHPPFIVATGQGDERLAVEMMKLGAADYLVKDLAFIDLLPGVLERVVEKLDTRRRLLAAENALRASEKRYRELVESANSIILRMTPQGRILFFNEFAESFFGYAKEEIIGRNVVGTILPVRDSQGHDLSAMIREIALQPDIYKMNENENMLKDGRRVWVAWSNNVVVNEHGEMELLCIGQDITQRKLAEEALLQAKEQAEAANQAKSEFLANMSHELRTPLNGIMGTMQLLETTPLDEEQRRYVALAIRSSDRLARLLTDLLDISRIEAGRLDIVDEELNMREVHDSVCELFAISAREKKIALDCRIDPAMPETLLGDAARLRQVLFNLVGNALKFTRQGSVCVEMTPLGSERKDVLRVLFSVSDTGIGIPEDKLNDVFKPFVQVDGSYTRSFQGAGLGLAIVKRLVDLMGGNIHIDSLPGEGTTVHVVLPFRLPEGVATDIQASVEAKKTKPALRILLAEDDPSNALPTMKLLANAGHTVNLAEDGQQVLDLYAVHDFDVILMDVQMPVMNGVEATRMIRSQESEVRSQEPEAGKSTSSLQVSGFSPQPFRRTPIIALTAYAMLGDREYFLEAGMDDYLAKPIQMADLERVLERVTCTKKSPP